MKVSITHEKFNEFMTALSLDIIQDQAVDVLFDRDIQYEYSKTHFDIGIVATPKEGSGLRGTIRIDIKFTGDIANKLVLPAILPLLSEPPLL